MENDKNFGLNNCLPFSRSYIIINKERDKRSIRGVYRFLDTPYLYTLGFENHMTVQSDPTKYLCNLGLHSVGLVDSSPFPLSLSLS